MTTFSVSSVNEVPKTSLTDTRKLALPPKHLPFCLLFARRASYDGEPVAVVADRLLEEFEHCWRGNDSLEALAHNLHREFTFLEAKTPIEAYQTDEGVPVETGFLGLLCGYAENSDSPEFWVIDVTTHAPIEVASSFYAIGMLEGEAHRYLMEIDLQNPWYRDTIRNQFGLRESVRELSADTAATAAVSGLRLAELHPNSAGLGPFIGGIWRSVVITPGATGEIVKHEAPV